MSMVSVGLRPRGRELPLWVNASGAFAWACFGIAVLALAYDHGDARSVISAYRLGSDRFFDLQPLYAGVMGYLYPPAFAVATEPFWLLGVPFDGMAWRVVGYAVLTYAIVRQAARLETPNRLWMISTALFFAIPVCAAAFRNGQSTILLAGACWLAVAGAMEGRPWRVAGWAAVALLAKPTALVLLLLICALRPRMIVPVVGALLFVVALPFAFAPTDYVLEQTLAFGRLFTTMSTETAAAFIPSDFTAVLKVIGLPIGDGPAMLVRMVAALATLAAVLAVAAKRRDAVGVLAIVTVGTFYTCLFNPRVECNTYAMFAPPASLAIAWMLSRRGLFTAAIIPALVLSLGGLQGIHPIAQEIGRFWLAPTVTMIVMGILAWWYVNWRVHDGMTRLDVVVPVYNEAESAASFCALVAAFEAQVQSRFGFSVHKIIVDDGSTDGSVGILSKTLAGSWEMVRLSRNFGKELAVLAGLDRSAGDYTLIMDADLQHSAEVALGMLAELHADREIDVVFARIAQRSESRTRGWLSRRFYELMNAGQRYEIPANGGDFRVMRRPVVEAFRRLRDHQRFNKGLYAWAGFRQKAVDYMPAPRVAGNTKWSRLSLLALSVEAITSFSVVPLRMIALLGLVVALAGMAYGLSIVVEVIFNGVAVPGYPSLVVAVVVLGGFNLALLGVIGEYLWVAVSEGKDRPPYLVRDITSSAQQAGSDGKPAP